MRLVVVWQRGWSGRVGLDGWCGSGAGWVRLGGGGVVIERVVLVLFTFFLFIGWVRWY